MHVPKLPATERDAIERRDCATCGKSASEQRGGRNGLIFDPATGTFFAQCVTCWNASVEADRAQRAAELAARPKCEACGRKPQTWTLGATDGPVSVCGTCRNKVNRAVRSPMLFGPPSASRAQILAAARARRAA